jgi:hypothetical protein
MVVIQVAVELIFMVAAVVALDLFMAPEVMVALLHLLQRNNMDLVVADLAAVADGEEVGHLVLAVVV